MRADEAPAIVVQRKAIAKAKLTLSATRAELKVPIGTDKKKEDRLSRFTYSVQSVLLCREEGIPNTIRGSFKLGPSGYYYVTMRGNVTEPACMHFNEGDYTNEVPSV